MSKQDIKVGQEAAIEEPLSIIPSFGWRVARVTATGQVTVEREFDSGTRKRRFKPQSWDPSRLMEIGSGHSRFHVPTLRLDVDALRAEVEGKRARSAAASAINRVAESHRRVHSRWDKGSLDQALKEIEANVAAARVLVDAL